MGFKSIFRAFRSVQKPGVPFQTLTNFASTALIKYPYTELSDNGDPCMDVAGAQWMRDSGVPSSGPSNLPNFLHVPVIQTRTNVLAAQSAAIGQVAVTGGPKGFPCALYSVMASTTVAATFLQVHYPYNSVSGALADGAIPKFVVPMKAEPELLSLDLGIRTPINISLYDIPTQTLSGGMILYFSTTRDTLTKGPAGVIQATWAFYGVGAPLNTNL